MTTCSSAIRVTSRINHDKSPSPAPRRRRTSSRISSPATTAGSAPWICKLGPDGALYVADFYNRIIGHYEVPLNHPRRDRTSGRIWRVARKGFTGKLTECDLGKSSPSKLIEALGSPNLMLRGLALEHLLTRNELEQIGIHYGMFHAEVTPHELLAGKMDALTTSNWLWLG